MAAPLPHPHLFNASFGMSGNSADASASMPLARLPFDFNPMDSLNPFALDNSLTAFQLDGGVGNMQGAAQHDSAQVKPQVSTFDKTFDEDFVNVPFDLSSSGVIIHNSSDTFAFTLTSSTSADHMLPPLPALNMNPYTLDRGLESPLGLEHDSPYSQFLASPMFEEDAGDLPPPLDFDYPPLFPPVATSLAPAPALAPVEAAFPPPTSSADPNTRPTLHALPTFHHSPYTSSSSVTATPALTPSVPLAPPPSSTSTRPQPNGFKSASTPLLPMDAPIQPRSYLMPSTTSRKRKTSAVERELAKRSGAGKSTTPAPSCVEHGGGEEEVIPSDLVAAVERKRLQNTLAARKSRARKQERLGELEEKNRELEEENGGLKRRVEELEAMLKGLGLEV